MKKLIMLAMVLGLFMVGTAKADGAWVLWQRLDYNKYSSSSGKWNMDYGTWSVYSAYPSYQACIEAEEAVCTGQAKYPKYTECFIDIGSGSYSVMHTGDDKSQLIYYWKCLPELFDPRK